MTFQDDINRMLAEAYRDLDTASPDTPPLTIASVQKVYAMLPASLEQLVDSGAISEAEAREQGWTPYVPPPVSWRRRLRWRWQAWRERAGRKIGGWLAGVDLTERDED